MMLLSTKQEQHKAFVIGMTDQQDDKLHLKFIDMRNNLRDEIIFDKSAVINT